jgi:hypothetical protein
MPSIPQSLLWISLVVLWLFVLVPMLISKRDAVRRTSDVALATRVLNTGDGSRLLRRNRPAAGHNSDPHWQPDANDLDDYDDEADETDETEEQPRRAVVVAAPVADEPDYLDVDVVDEDSGALPVGASAAADAPHPLRLDAEPPLEYVGTAGDQDTEDTDDVEDAEEPDEADEVAEVQDENDGTDDEYEYVADSSGIEEQSETEATPADSLSAARRRRYESKTAAAVSARKYRFRSRMLTAMAVALVASAAAAYLVAPWAWYLCGAVGAVTLIYLMYLRRQTRIEERLRRRRAQRMMRSRLGVENAEDPKYDVVPARLRRPGADVLEIDDEDPIFEHLDYATFARHYDLPRAAGQ